MSTRILHRFIPQLRRSAIRIIRVLAVALAGLLLLVGYFWITTDLPSQDWLRTHAMMSNTRILDRYGHLLYQIPNPIKGRQRVVLLREIPLTLQQATIAIEDERFYRNSGVDVSAIARAAWTNLYSGEIRSGGSTITQQLARNELLDSRVSRQPTLERKVREMVLAIKLTMNYPKDDILALYLNETYYGGMSYGVEAAAWHFFGKPVRDLSLAECALLAGLPQSPSRYDPFVNSKIARERQAQVLDAMTQNGFITAAQAAAAEAEPLQFASDGATMRAPHFVHYIVDQLIALLGSNTVIRGGLTITTTLDADLQDASQKILRRHTGQLSTPIDGQPDHHVRNGAVVVLDPSNGAILAMIGSPNFDDPTIQGQVNGALALRQPGSAIKPLTYASAIEHGWTPATTILDVPSAFPTREGRPYMPQNYDRTYHGPISLREALATSSNVAAVRTLDSIGIPALLEIASRLGISTLGEDNKQYGLALTLGGGEVTLLELTGAYGAFANRGQTVTPFAVTRVTNASGKDVQLPGQSPSWQALSPQVAYLITDILSDSLARMRAFGAVSPLDLDRVAAVKTGTTTNWRDNWTIGYTTSRIVGVWTGNADGQPMEDVSGLTGAAPIWHDVMIVANRGLPAESFKRPDGIIELSVCVEGGMLPSPQCPGVRLERFIEGTQPTRPDDTHVLIPIDPELNCRAPRDYPVVRRVLRPFRLLPPEAVAWATTVGIPQPPAQVCREFTSETSALTHDQDEQSLHLTSSSTLTPRILAPSLGAVYSISPGVPAERQRIELRALAGEDTVSLTISIDGEPVATLDRPPYRTLWKLSPGKHYERRPHRKSGIPIRAVNSPVRSSRNWC